MIKLDTLTKDEVRLIQKGLASESFNPGPFDGILGSKTESAFKAWKFAMVSPNLSIGKEVARIATGELGVREVPKNSNTGPRVQEYQNADWLDKPSTRYAWCASFVCWCVREALELGYSVSWNRPLTAGAWDFIRWAKEEGLPVLASSESVLEGDIIVFTFPHIGIAVKDVKAGESVETVEGNTDPSGGREGGGVYRQTRPRKLIKSIIRLQ